MKTIWTNGCFDILHRGHIELFKYASLLGDELVVGVDTDEKVRLDKGEFLYRWIDTETAETIEQKLKVGDVVRQRVGQPHQLEALTDGVVFEVSTQHFDEDSYRVWKGDSQ